MQVGRYSAPQANRQATRASAVMLSVESVCTRLQAKGDSVDVSLNALQNFVFTTGIHRRAHSPPKEIQGLKRWIVMGGVGRFRLFWVHAEAFGDPSFLFCSAMQAIKGRLCSKLKFRPLSAHRDCCHVF